LQLILIVGPCDQPAAPSKLTPAAALDDKESVSIDNEGRAMAAQLQSPRGLLYKEKVADYASQASKRQFQSMLGHLPYNLLREILEGASKETWYNWVDQEVLNQGLLREEWTIRAAFLRGGESDTRQITPLYDDGTGKLRSVHPRELTEHEMLHSRIEGWKNDGAKPLELEPDMLSFKTAFGRFTNGVLDGIWDGHQGAEVFCAGGAVLASAAYREEHSWTVAQQAKTLYRMAVNEIPKLSVLARLDSDTSSSIARSISGYLGPVHFEAAAVERPQFRDVAWGAPSDSDYRYTVSSDFANSDLDIFVAADSVEAGRAAMRRVLLRVRANMSRHLMTMTSEESQRAGFDSAGHGEWDGAWDEMHDESKPFATRTLRLMRTANAVSVWGGPDSDSCRTVTTLVNCIFHSIFFLVNAEYIICNAAWLNMTLL
jgi:hypothetical protein